MPSRKLTFEILASVWSPLLLLSVALLYASSPMSVPSLDGDYLYTLRFAIPRALPAILFSAAAVPVVLALFRRPFALDLLRVVLPTLFTIFVSLLLVASRVFWSYRGVSPFVLTHVGAIILLGAALPATAYAWGAYRALQSQGWRTYFVRSEEHPAA